MNQLSQTSFAPVSIKEPGQALALAQSTFGFLPRSSLVVIGLSQGETAGHLRVDLPQKDGTADQLSAYCAEVINTLSGDSDTGVPMHAMAIIFAEERNLNDPFRVEEEQRTSGLVEQLQTAFSSRGSSLVKIWWTDRERIRSFGCLDDQCCSVAGHDVLQVLKAAASSHPHLFSESTPDELLSDQPSFADQLQDFLEAEYHWAAQDLRKVNRAIKSYVLEPNSLEKVERAFDLWEDTCADALSTTLFRELTEDPHRLGILLASLDALDVRDGLIPLVVAGRAAAMHGVKSQRCTDDACANGLKNCANAALYAQSLLGLTGSTPDWGVIDNFGRLLQLLYYLATKKHRATILVFLCWIEWARGRGTVADLYLSASLRVDPRHQLARLLGDYIKLSGICPWAKAKRTSWSWNTSTEGKKSHNLFYSFGNEAEQSNVVEC